MFSIYACRTGLSHDTGPGHPECPDRLRVLYDLFQERQWPVTYAPDARYEWVSRAHPERYIDKLMDCLPDEGLAYIDGDTVLSPMSFDAALDAAGAVCCAVSDIVNGKISRAFCAIRPPGHHAEPSQAMGFCFFNNVFVGALHAQSLGLKRISIVDIDVHHGNGSDTMARQHDNITYISTHQWPLFPGTGGPDSPPHDRVLNIPLAAETSSADFRAIYEAQVFPRLLADRPDLLMVSAGFDAHREDPLAGLGLDDDDFGWLAARLRAVADQVCGGKMVSVLEGGYNLEALKRSAGAYILQLLT